ncbi:MAG: hypothetical protein WD875_16010, partial [Pirellulales bacterium]
MLFALFLLLYGRSPRVRDIVISIVSALVAATAGILAWYAWAESQTLAWTAGYALVCAAAFAACVCWGQRAIVDSAAKE